MVRWIKIPLGMEVGLGPGDIVLDGNPALLTERGTQTDVHQIFRVGRHVGADVQSRIRFMIGQGTLPWQPILCAKSKSVKRLPSWDSHSTTDGRIQDSKADGCIDTADVLSSLHKIW